MQLRKFVFNSGFVVSEIKFRCFENSLGVFWVDLFNHNKYIGTLLWYVQFNFKRAVLKALQKNQTDLFLVNIRTKRHINRLESISFP